MERDWDDIRKELESRLLKDAINLQQFMGTAAIKMNMGANMLILIGKPEDIKKLLEE